MAVKKFNPITPGTRFRVASDRKELTRGYEPEKSLLYTISATGGRNSDGRRTMRYRGGGHKRRFRVIDFQRNKEGVATVDSIQYDPNRTAFIALVKYNDGEKSYILATKGMKPGDTVVSGKGVAPENGNCMFLSRCHWVLSSIISKCSLVQVVYSCAVPVLLPPW